MPGGHIPDPLRAIVQVTAQSIRHRECGKGGEKTLVAFNDLTTKGNKHFTNAAAQLELERLVSQHGVALATVCFLDVSGTGGPAAKFIDKFLQPRQQLSNAGV